MENFWQHIAKSNTSWQRLEKTVHLEDAFQRRFSDCFSASAVPGSWFQEKNQTSRRKFTNLRTNSRFGWSCCFCQLIFIACFLCGSFSCWILESPPKDRQIRPLCLKQRTLTFHGGSESGEKRMKKLVKLLHPGRLTCNIIMEVWKIIFLSKWAICRFHVNLPGCTLW